MEAGYFWDVQAMADEYLTTSRMKISALSRMKVTCESVATRSILTKKTYGSAKTWSEVQIMKKHKKVADLPDTIPVLGKKPTLDANKRQNLMEIMEYLPEKSREFYNLIL